MSEPIAIDSYSALSCILGERIVYLHIFVYLAVIEVLGTDGSGAEGLGRCYDRRIPIRQSVSLLDV